MVVVGIIGRLDAGGIGRVRTIYWRPTGVYTVQCCVFRVYCVRSSLSVHSGQVKTGWREQAIACRPPCRAALVADCPAGLSNQP